MPTERCLFEVVSNATRQRTTPQCSAATLPTHALPSTRAYSRPTWSSGLVRECRAAQRRPRVRARCLAKMPNQTPVSLVSRPLTLHDACMTCSPSNPRPHRQGYTRPRTFFHRQGYTRPHFKTKLDAFNCKYNFK